MKNTRDRHALNPNDLGTLYARHANDANRRVKIDFDENFV